jgi:SAM-dependent methyltransferase
MSELLFGYAPAQLAYVMARLRLADWIENGSTTVAELSSAANAQPHMMRRLVRGLAGIGLVTLEIDGRISLTELGELLSSRAGSMRDLALYRGRESFVAWGKLEHAVRTGEPAFDAAYGDGFFSYLRKHPEAGTAFDGAMEQLSQRVIAEAIAHYDFGAASRILDVGGGRGHFASAVLEAHPGLEGAVFDVPEVADAAREQLRRSGLGARCAAIPGDFFTALPAGYDLQILKWVLHNWDDEACERLLRACRTALPDHGRLLVVELLLPDAVPASGSLHPAIAMDLSMLVNFAVARERYLDEYEQLLARSGFAVHGVVPLPSGSSILDCRPSPDAP